MATDPRPPLGDGITLQIRRRPAGRHRPGRPREHGVFPPPLPHRHGGCVRGFGRHAGRRGIPGRVRRRRRESFLRLGRGSSGFRSSPPTKSGCHVRNRRERRGGCFVFRFRAVRDDARGDPEVGGVKGEDALDVRKHEAVGGRVGRPRGLTGSQGGIGLDPIGRR